MKFKIGDMVVINDLHYMTPERVGKIIRTKNVNGRWEYEISWNDISDITFFDESDLIQIIPPNELLKEIL